MKSLFNEYEASCNDTARAINDRIRDVVAEIIEEYQDEYPIREIEYIIWQTVHCIACERIITRGIAKRKAKTQESLAAKIAKTFDIPIKKEAFNLPIKKEQ